MDKKITVAILNWNGKELMQQFLPSVCAHTSPELAQVVVIDNGSSDDSIPFLQKEFPSVQIIPLSSNLGFAAGYNEGLKQIDTPYAVLLNSDVEVTPDWLEPVLQYMESNTDVAACQPKIRAYREPEMFEHAGACGGYIDKYGFPYCRGRILSAVEQDSGQYDTITDVFWATGAAMFVRVKDYFDVGGLDARFFAHMEEIDLCWRMQLAGKRISVVPDSVVYHLGGATLDMKNPRKTYLNFRNNLLMLYKNLPRNERDRFLFVRRLIDSTAMVKFLLSGEWDNVKAVWKAHGDFRRMKKLYAHNHPSKNILHNFPQSRRNITLDYFLLGKKVY